MKWLKRWWMDFLTVYYSPHFNPAVFLILDMLFMSLGFIFWAAFVRGVL